METDMTALPTSMSSKLLRNWEIIAKIPCDATRYALATCQHSELMRGWMHAFPGCFRQGSVDEVDLFSWQHILRAANRYRSRSTPDGVDKTRTPYAWLGDLYDAPALDDEDRILAGIPVFRAWDVPWQKKQDFPPTDVTALIAAQAKNALKGPFFLEYEGTRCVVGYMRFDGSYAHEGQALAGHDIMNGPFSLALVPAHVICFDC